MWAALSKEQGALSPLPLSTLDHQFTNSVQFLRVSATPSSHTQFTVNYPPQLGVQQCIHSSACILCSQIQRVSYMFSMGVGPHRAGIQPKTNTIAYVHH